MTRLFPILYVLIVVTLIGVFVSIQLFDNFIMGRLQKDSYNEMFTAPFMLLDDSVSGLEGNALQEQLQHIRSTFKFPVDLVADDSTKLTTAQLRRINNGGTVGISIDNAHTLFRRSIIENHLWRYVVFLNEYEREVAVGTGPLTLFKKQLHPLTSEQRQKVIKEFTQRSGYPLTIGNIDTFNFSEEEKSKLLKNLVVVRKPGKPGEQFFIQIDDEHEILRATVAGYPWYAAYLIPLVLLVALLSLALFSMFWLWPLWRDLRSLKQTSKSISEGKLDARVKAGRPSIIKPVLVGFNSMVDSSQKMITSQKELTDAVSHEIRTPLARMKFGLEMLDEATEPEERIRHVKGMRFDINELNSLVDELLSFAREDNYVISGVNETLTAFKAREWLEQQLQLAARSHPDIQLQLDFTAQKDIHMNKKSMTRAVSNGLQNALRYSSEKVVLGFSINGNNYELTIEDDGPGIPKEFRDNIFEPFKRTDNSRSRDFGGFGLGLAIVKRTAEAHNGSVHIEDSLLGGNRLAIRWPVASSMQF